MGLRDVYELELGTYPLIDRMSYVGIKPDLPHFAAMSEDLQFEIDALRTELCRTTGIADFNANSGDQVANYLFGSLGLEGYKRTSEGRYSTNDKVLEALEKEHPEIIDLQTIRSYREVYKLKNTFVDRIPDFVRRYPFDGRVHATFRTTSVVTGRLAASDPNLLAQPKHGQFAKRFRRGWIAADGHWLGVGLVAD
jgi:DNA polymerase-1